MAGKTLPSSNGYFNKAMLNILESDTQKSSKSTSNNTGKSTGNNTSKNTGKKK